MFPGNRRPSAQEVELGKTLFFDPRLARDQSLSCAGCHHPETGFADKERTALGFGGKRLNRHTPTVLNVGLESQFFWDGRADTLEEQAQAVIENPDELNMSVKEVIQRLEQVPYYAETFAQVYPKEGLTSNTLLRAIANFERTLLANQSPFDLYLSGDDNALSQEARRGLELFRTKANCTKCHHGPNLSDGQFHNTGVKTDDLGRILIVRNTESRMRATYPIFANYKAFKTPGLRNVALTAPYFHNGSIASLEEVIDLYDQGGLSADRRGRSPDIKPLHLNAQEKSDLVAFLKSLTSPIAFSPPQIPE